MTTITAGSVDGYIRISTDIDAKPFNKGVSKMSSGFAKLGQSLKTFAKALSIGALLIFGVALKQMFGSIRESVMNLINVNMKGSQLGKDIEGIKNQFTELKFSIAAAFLPLITFAIPYIKQALDWLIKFFNRAAMITAAFTGQKEVLQVVAGSAAELAQNTEDAEKAARGALAAFDQINVLSKPETAANISPSELPQVMTQLVPVTDEILAKVQLIKDIIASWWNDPMGTSIKFKEAILGDTAILENFLAELVIRIILLWKQIDDNFIKKLAVGLYMFVEDTKVLFKDLWAVITDDSLTVPEKIKEIWNILVDFFKVHITDVLLFQFEKLKEDISNLWLGLEEYVKSIWVNIVEWFTVNILNPLRDKFIAVWDGLKTNAINAWDGLKANAISAKDAITSAWLGIVNWFKTNILDPLKNGFSNALDFISDNFSNIFTGIKDIVKGIINNIINFINTMIDSIIGGINAVIDAANSIGNIIPGYSAIGNIAPPQIPGLATGGLIPPNARFAAILGDNKRENEIIAPESAIRGIVEEVVGKAIANQNIHISFDGDLGALVRELKPRIDQENSRVGGSLIKSGVI